MTGDIGMNNRYMNMDAALAAFLDHLSPIERSKTIRLEDADNRVVSGDVIAPMDYPHYDQCILDGYAVRASDTAGCGNGSDRVLLLTTKEELPAGYCAVAHTGSALPVGADALLPWEDVTESAESIQPLKEVTPGQWVWPKGAGIGKGKVVFRDGMALKPTDINMLAKLGISDVRVYDRPRVLIIPTGDECVKRGETIAAGFVYETNGLMCSLLVKRYGGIPTLHEIVPDDMEKLQQAIGEGLGYDLIVTIGGSAAGKRDLMAQVLSETGQVVFHGVALHPGNHMGVGFVQEEKRKTPVVFLSGYAESCAVGAFHFVDPTVRTLGRSPVANHPREQVLLAAPVESPVGIRSVRKMNIQDGSGKTIKLIAESSLPGQYAYLVIPEMVSEFQAGKMVEVVYFE